MSVNVRGASMSPYAVAHAIAFIARLRTAGLGPAVVVVVEVEDAAAALAKRHTAAAVSARVNGFVKAVLKLSGDWTVIVGARGPIRKRSRQ